MATMAIRISACPCDSPFFLVVLADADFVIGYGFDNNEKLWKVYQNNERGMKAEWTFENEEEALEKLYKKVKFQYKIIN